MKLWPGAPARGVSWVLGPPGRSLCALFAVCLLATTSTVAHAQPRRPKPEAAPKGEAKDPAAPKDVGAPKDGATKDGSAKDAAKDPKTGKAKVFDFTGIDLAGRLHTPQLLYFLERANEELERAFLERRSFIPHMVRSLDEEAL